jgi:hypothetical protein
LFVPAGRSIEQHSGFEWISTHARWPIGSAMSRGLANRSA